MTGSRRNEWDVTNDDFEKWTKKVINCYVLDQGWMQNFLKEGAHKLKTDRTSAPVGTGVSKGDVPIPSEVEKICNFQSQLYKLVHSFWSDVPTQPRTSAKKYIGGACRLCSPPPHLIRPCGLL